MKLRIIRIILFIIGGLILSSLYWVIPYCSESQIDPGLTIFIPVFVVGIGGSFLLLSFLLK